MKTFKLHFVRHGLTQGNLEGLYVGGGTDFPLCEEGRSQLQALRARFAYPAVDTVFVSPLRRCTETATVLFPGARQYQLDGLREMDFGVFEGRSMQELLGDAQFAAWMDPGRHEVPEGAEERGVFYRRCGEVFLKMFEFMIKAKVYEAACVTHGGVLMNMLAQHALPQVRPEAWTADPGCGYTLRTDVAMWMRSGLAEAIDVVPQGYLDEEKAE